MEYWNKYESKVTVEEQNRYLDFLINPSFQGINRRLVSSFENSGGRTIYTRYYLTKVERKNYNIIIDGRNFFDKFRKIATGKGYDYTTGYLLDYNHFNIAMIAISLFIINSSFFIDKFT